MPLPPQSLASLTSGGGFLGLEQSLPLTTSWQWLLRGIHLRSGGLMVFVWTQHWMALTCSYLMSLVFTNKEYNSSTLEIQGVDRFYQKYREVSVVLGTGIFRLARGMLFWRLFIWTYPILMQSSGGMPQFFIIDFFV